MLEDLARRNNYFSYLFHPWNTSFSILRVFHQFRQFIIRIFSCLYCSCLLSIWMRVCIFSINFRFFWFWMCYESSSIIVSNIFGRCNSATETPCISEGWPINNSIDFLFAKSALNYHLKFSTWPAFCCYRKCIFPLWNSWR